MVYLFNLIRSSLIFHLSYSCQHTHPAHIWLGLNLSTSFVFVYYCKFFYFKFLFYIPSIQDCKWLLYIYIVSGNLLNKHFWKRKRQSISIFSLIVQSLFQNILKKKFERKIYTFSHIIDSSQEKAHKWLLKINKKDPQEAWNNKSWN